MSVFPEVCMQIVVMLKKAYFYFIYWKILVINKLGVFGRVSKATLVFTLTKLKKTQPTYEDSFQVPNFLWATTREKHSGNVYGIFWWVTLSLCGKKSPFMKRRCSGFITRENGSQFIRTLRVVLSYEWLRLYSLSLSGIKRFPV